MTKQEIRAHIFDLRKKMSLDEISSYSQKAIQSIKEDLRYQKSKVVAIYYPMHQEINLLGLMEDHTKIFCFPKVEGKYIRFYRINERTTFETSAFGVREPKDGTIIKDIDYMIVPALAISKTRYRIGYGKGFYDRYLKNNRPKHAIGIIYSFAEIESFEVSPFDEILDDYIKV